MVYQRVLCFLCVLASAACQSKDTIIPPPTFADHTTTLNRLYDAASAGKLTPNDTIPATGTATYSGIVEVLPKPSTSAPGLIGILNATVTFADTAGISGSVTDVIDKQNTAWNGTLAIANLTLDRNAINSLAPQYTASLQGDLMASATNQLSINGTLNWDFRGTDAQLLDGVVKGSGTHNGATYTLSGVYAAAK